MTAASASLSSALNSHRRMELLLFSILFFVQSVSPMESSTSSISSTILSSSPVPPVHDGTMASQMNHSANDEQNSNSSDNFSAISASSPSTYPPPKIMADSASVANSSSSASTSSNISSSSAASTPSPSSSSSFSPSSTTVIPLTSNSSASITIANSSLLHSSADAPNANLTVRSPPSSFNQSNRAHDSPEEFIERPISGEDISGINEDDDNDDDAQQHNSQWNGTIGRDELLLPLLPSHLTIPAQQHHPMFASEGRGNDTTTNTSSSGRLIMDDESGRNHSTAHRSTKVENSQINSTAAEGNNSIRGHRTKRDYVSDAVQKMNEAINNPQQPMSVPSIDGNGAVGFPSSSASFQNMSSPQKTQIIPIPSIDLSGQTQNIILVSDNGNVTLRRGNGFLSVETVMMQPQPKN